MAQDDARFTGLSVEQIKDAYFRAQLAHDLLEMGAIQWFRNMTAADQLDHVTNSLWKLLLQRFHQQRDDLVETGNDAQFFAALIAMGLIGRTHRNEMLGLPADAALTFAEKDCEP